MSLRREFAQNPLRSFVVTQNSNDTYTGTGAYFFSQNDIDTWYAANEENITKLGKSLYIIPGTTAGSTFHDVITGASGATQLNHTLPGINQRKTVKDLGKEIIIGNNFVTRLLVLRLVQRFTNSTDGGSLSPDDTGYVVVENNSLDVENSDSGRYTVRVARI